MIEDALEQQVTTTDQGDVVEGGGVGNNNRNENLGVRKRTITNITKADVFKTARYVTRIYSSRFWILFKIGIQSSYPRVLLWPPNSCVLLRYRLFVKQRWRNSDQERCEFPR